MPMSHKLQDAQKVATEVKILTLLSRRGNLRWQELKHLTGLSSRTLSDRLQDLTSKDLVRRKVDVTSRPPSTYYGINPTIGKIDFPPGTLHAAFRDYLDKRNQSTNLFKIAGKRTPREVLQTTFRSISHDILFTVNYCMDNPENAQYIILFYLDMLQSQLSSLLSFAKKNPEFRVEIKELLKESIKEQEKYAEKVIENFLDGFEDKELARATLMIYFKEAFTQNMELFIFLAQVSQSEELRNKIAQIFGHEIDEERLNKLISENAWKDLESFSSTLKQITND